MQCSNKTLSHLTTHRNLPKQTTHCAFLLAPKYHWSDLLHQRDKLACTLQKGHFFWIRFPPSAGCLPHASPYSIWSPGFCRLSTIHFPSTSLSKIYRTNSVKVLTPADFFFFLRKQCLVTHSISCAPRLGFQDLHQRMGSLPIHLNLSPLPPVTEASLDLLFSLVLFSFYVMSDSLWLHVWQQNRLPCLSIFCVVSPNSCPLSQWCHVTISSFWSLSFCLQSFPASGSLPMNWLFTSDGVSVGASSSASVLPLNIALPLSKQNSCFQSSNKFEHW